MARKAQWFRSCAAIAVAAVVLFAAYAAHAAGRVEWKSRTIEERSGSWKVELSMYLPSPPGISLVPMRFSFEPKVYYERTLVDDHDGPVLRKVPLEHRQPIVESVDVGFMDPGTGKIQKRTKFSFKVTRAHGFEAGEYQVKITNSTNNQTVGTPVTLTFNGENEIIDRRSMVFTGNEKKKKKEDEAKSDESSEEPQEKELTPEDDEFWEGGPKSDPNGPPAIEEKPGGCGCRLESKSRSSDRAALVLAGLISALAFSWRRRRLGAP